MKSVKGTRFFVLVFSLSSLTVFALPLFTALNVGQVLKQTTSGDVDKRCVRCPSCLQRIHGNCLNKSAYVRKHPDCFRAGSGALCNRSVWACPNTGVWFTWPMLTGVEVEKMYRHEYNGQSITNLEPKSQRMSAQYKYIRELILDNRNYGSEGVKYHILEIGCAGGYLLQMLAPWSSMLTCFEPSPRYSELAKNVLLTNATNIDVRVFASNWNASMISDSSIDIFISSHVLEHIPDLCLFFTQLYERMKPGGAVFSEVPSHNHDVVATTFGGMFHVTLFDARGWILMMEAVGFELMHIEKTGANERTVPNGYHIRAIFTKPGHPSQSKRPKWKGLGS